ncbi:COX15/CtaA family protein [Mucilaginibacter auburnensis]|uniref:Cytochrome c oxidase assembly protein subunit 15 n=1 Tax=Mucilaginibacter auburnensis TaxID=1457233 RepID=A0A2H9VSV7_9SPHI|nr:COX15/CtaA family protein [Mucilaginibacter auburnensis]PJJ83907.1 cytochrome c oxidase assembly protein subunit 15 [Mucilaginibacter auburnensis]
MQKTTAKQRFQRLNLYSIIALFAVILAGGVVRSSGSGMGCPDWPKCFGQYIPPTSVDQLPADYKDKYVEGRMAKNQKFAKTLDVFGYADLAQRIRDDKSILVPEEFNAGRTWTEYVNRLVGAASGIFLLLTAVYSFSYRDKSKLIPFLSVFNLLLIFFQAWLGSIVVSTNLVAWIVTVHMLLALAIVAICITTYHLARASGRPVLRVNALTYIVTVVALILSVVQITIGTEVRERIDAVATRLQDGYRSTWITNAGKIFTDHRELAMLVLVINLVLYLLIRRGFNRHSIQQQIMSFSFLMVVLQMVTGVVLAYLALPPVAQASHIFLASLLFGAQFYLLLNLYRSASLHGGTA